MNKRLIVYYSKNGTTEETVERIKEEIPKGVDTFDLQSMKRSIRGELLDQYEEIYIGCGIYFGRLPSKIVRFLYRNQDVLKSKRLILFLHGLISDTNYTEIVERSLKKCKALNFKRIWHLGGKLNIRKQNIFVRTLLSTIAKEYNFDLSSGNHLNEENIIELIKCFSPD